MIGFKVKLYRYIPQGDQEVFIKDFHLVVPQNAKEYFTGDGTTASQAGGVNKFCKKLYDAGHRVGDFSSACLWFTSYSTVSSPTGDWGALGKPVFGENLISPQTFGLLQNERLRIVFEDDNHYIDCFTAYDSRVGKTVSFNSFQYCYKNPQSIAVSFNNNISREVISLPWFFPDSPGGDSDRLMTYAFNFTKAIHQEGGLTWWELNGLEVNRTHKLPYNIKGLNASELRWFGSSPTPIDPSEPYAWIDKSTTGGGVNGNYSEETDHVEEDLLPELSAVGTGFATIFKPDRSQLKHLSELFWNSNFFTFMQNLVENINEMFTSLAIVPFNVPAGNTVSVTWLGFDTAVSLTLAAQQYLEFDMGAINMATDPRCWSFDNCLDYSPYSRLGIYLPFIGYQELDIDECRGCVIGLKYRIDILSGACVALVSVNTNVIYQFTGNCLTQIPITSESMTGLVQDAVQVGIAAASGGASSAVASGAAAGDTMSQTAMAGAMEEESFSLGEAVRGNTRLASATANAAMGAKPSYKKSGSVSSAASMLGVKQPYLFLTTPRQSIPDNYGHYCGIPSNITSRLGDLSGYTVVEDIRLNGLVATEPEVAEIYSLLKGGVII